MSAEEEPKLDAPGKGLPLHELLIGRYILFPMSIRKLTKETAIEKLPSLGRKILEQARALDEEQLNEKVLIPRFPGIEDSSRNWSVLMTIEHLLVTGKAMGEIVKTLSSLSTWTDFRGQGQKRLCYLSNL